MNYLNYLAIILSLVGNWGVVRKQRWGLVCWLFSNTIWILHFLALGDCPSLIMFSIYQLMAIYGVCTWQRNVERSER